MCVIRNLSAIQDREICCYSISCKEKDNIGTEHNRADTPQLKKKSKGSAGDLKEHLWHNSLCSFIFHSPSCPVILKLLVWFWFHSFALGLFFLVCYYYYYYYYSCFCTQALQPPPYFQPHKKRVESKYKQKKDSLGQIKECMFNQYGRRCHGNVHVHVFHTMTCQGWQYCSYRPVLFYTTDSYSLHIEIHSDGFTAISSVKYLSTVSICFTICPITNFFFLTFLDLFFLFCCCVL